jgi:hypothetical protein
VPNCPGADPCRSVAAAAGTRDETDRSTTNAKGRGGHAEEGRQRRNANFAHAEELRPEPGEQVLERRVRLVPGEIAEHRANRLVEHDDGRRLVAKELCTSSGGS